MPLKPSNNGRGGYAANLPRPSFSLGQIAAQRAAGINPKTGRARPPMPLVLPQGGGRLGGQPTSLGALATSPMPLGAPGVPPAASPTRQAWKESGPPSPPPTTGYSNQGMFIKPNSSGLDSSYFPSMPAAKPAFTIQDNPAFDLGQGPINLNMGGRPANDGPRQPAPRQVAQPVNQPNGLGTFRAANNPNNAYGGGGGTVMNIPNPAYTQALMQGAQNNAMNSAVAGANQTRVSGPLSSVTGPSGALQNPGLYTAQYNNSPKAQQSIGAMGDVGDARWRANMGPNDTYTDQGQVIRGGGGGSGTGTTGAAGASGSSGAAAGGTSPPNGAQQILDPLVAQFQQAMDDSNAANDARDVRGMTKLETNEARSQADLARMGQSRAQEIRDGARRAEAQGMQNLTARGLANTTNLPTMQRGVQRDANRAMTQLGDVMAQNRYNQNRQNTLDQTSWIFNRDDQGPNYDTLANLALGLAQSQVQPPAFDINDVLSRLGRQPSIQDLLSMLPQMQGGNLQQPNQQFPQLPRVNFPQQQQQIQGGMGNDFIFEGNQNFGGLGGLAQQRQQQQQPPVQQQPQQGGSSATGASYYPGMGYGWMNPDGSFMSEEQWLFENGF